MDLTQEMLKCLDVLAAKLGVTAQYLWAILVRQARVEAIQDCIVFALALCVTAAMGYWWYKILKKANGDYFGNISPTEGILSWIASMIALFLLGCSMANMCSLPTKLMNPEYFALQKVLDVLK